MKTEFAADFTNPFRICAGRARDCPDGQVRPGVVFLHYHAEAVGVARPALWTASRDERVGIAWIPAVHAVARWIIAGCIWISGGNCRQKREGEKPHRRELNWNKSSWRRGAGMQSACENKKPNRFRTSFRRFRRLGREMGRHFHFKPKCLQTALKGRPVCLDSPADPHNCLFGWFGVNVAAVRLAFFGCDTPLAALSPLQRQLHAAGAGFPAQPQPLFMTSSISNNCSGGLQIVYFELGTCPASGRWRGMRRLDETKMRKHSRNERHPTKGGIVDFSEIRIVSSFAFCPVVPCEPNPTTPASDDGEDLHRGFRQWMVDLLTRRRYRFARYNACAPQLCRFRRFLQLLLLDIGNRNSPAVF